MCNKGFGYLNIKDICGTATLYLLEVTTRMEDFLKVGVTLQPLRRRISNIKSELGSEYVDIRVLHTVQAPPTKILALESKLLNKSRFIKHNTNLKFAGKTELLSLANSITEIINEMDSNE